MTGAALLQLRPNGHMVAIMNLEVAIVACTGEGCGVADEAHADEPEDSNVAFRTAFLHRRCSFRLSNNTVVGRINGRSCRVPTSRRPIIVAD
jgi:hypothetical protein